MLLVWLAKGSQVAPLQQPEAQEFASQVQWPPTHSVPLEHAAQLAPPVPQVALLDV
jgi:hypothetical protein